MCGCDEAEKQLKSKLRSSTMTQYIVIMNQTEVCEKYTITNTVHLNSLNWITFMFFTKYTSARKTIIYSYFDATKSKIY